MKFSDQLIRSRFETVYVKRTLAEMRARPEADSLLWDIVKHNVAFDPSTRTSIHLISVPARDVKIGETIFNSYGLYLAYRSS